MKKFWLTFSGLLLAALCFGADADADQKESDWMKTFYRTKEVKSFDGFWKKVMRDKLLENENAATPTISFASQVLHQYPELLKGRLDDLKKIPEAQRGPCALILWYSDTPAAKKILAQTDYRTDVPVPPIGDKKITEPADLDFCWGWFFATGDTRALDPIISALAFDKYIGAIDKYKTSQKTEADRDAAYKEAMFKAAMWSLEVNGREDATISGHLRKVVDNPATSVSTQIWLALLLGKIGPNQYKEPGAFQLAVTGRQRDESDRRADDNRGRESYQSRSVDGFGALVVATADPDWRKKWNEVPESEPFQCESTTQLRRGENVTLLLSFTNPLPSKNGKINVRYDVKITKPNGKTGGKKNLLGADRDMTGKTLTYVYLADELMGFSGDDDDPPGEWIFEFAVRDLNRKVTVPLKLTLTLRDK